MKTKQEILDKVSIDSYVMKSKTISHIILEGTDGVGKTTMLVNLLRLYNYRYVVYDRGELSNMFYAKKYNRPFVSLQRNLPFLHVVLTCDKQELKKRIIARQKDRGVNNLELIEELAKINDQDKIVELAESMKNDFHIIIVDITALNEYQAVTKVAQEIDKYVNALPCDKEETQWNESYRLACEKLGLSFKVRANQPYINDQMMMSESTWQNGIYETFRDKTCPDNLIFSLSYDYKKWIRENNIKKDLDFAYVINSKINRRHEIIDYYLKMLENDKTCLVSEKIHDAFEDERFKQMPRTFGDGFINQLSRANATIYCARDLEYLKLQTCRLYEAILSRQILFVDKESDKDCDMLKQIYGNDTKLIDLLYVTPDTFIENYNKIMKNDRLHQKILSKQLMWYKNLLSRTFEGIEL